MKMELQQGKRYMWPITIPSDGRIKSGLFTGQYDKNGSAILMTKTGETWSIPVQNCAPAEKHKH